MYCIKILLNFQEIGTQFSLYEFLFNYLWSSENGEKLPSLKRVKDSWVYSYNPCSL